MAKSHPSALGAEPGTSTSFYVDFVARDLRMIVECVVPEGRQGLPNLTSTKQVRPLYEFFKIQTPTFWIPDS